MSSKYFYSSHYCLTGKSERPLELEIGIDRCRELHIIDVDIGQTQHSSNALSVVPEKHPPSPLSNPQIQQLLLSCPPPFFSTF
jgi:hypothetical protein